MKNIICFFSLILVFIPSYAQIMDLPGEFIRQKVVGDKELPSNVKGSIFFNEAFLIGKIHTNDNNSFKSYLRYDAFNDEMQMKQDGKIIALMKFENGKVDVGNSLYEIHNYYNKEKGEDKKGYFINLTKPNNVQILKHMRKKFIAEAKAKNSYSADKPPMFKDDISYYIMLNNNDKLVKINLSKKNLLKLLADKKKELTKYISDNKLKLKKDEMDYIQLVNYYNTL